MPEGDPVMDYLVGLAMRRRLCLGPAGDIRRDAVWRMIQCDIFFVLPGENPLVVELASLVLETEKGK